MRTGRIVPGITAPGWKNLLKFAEYAANLLEAGELVPMAYPPTAKIAATEDSSIVDAMEIEDYLDRKLDWNAEKACHIIEKGINNWKSAV